MHAHTLLVAAAWTAVQPAALRISTSVPPGQASEPMANRAIVAMPRQVIVRAHQRNPSLCPAALTVSKTVHRQVEHKRAAWQQRDPAARTHTCGWRNPPAARIQRGVLKGVQGVARYRAGRL